MDIGEQVFSLSGLLSPYFKELSTKGIKYCVLRGYDKLPDETRYDVDIAINESDLLLAISLLRDAASNSGWTMVGSMKRDGFSRILLYHPNYEKVTLPIDFIMKHAYRGFFYAENEVLLNDTVDHKSLCVARSGHEAAISFVGKLIVGKGTEINSEKLSRIQRLAQEDETGFVHLLSESLGNTISQKLYDSIKVGDWDTAFKIRGKIMTASIKKTGVIRSILNMIKSLYESVKGRLQRRGGMSMRGGLFLVLLGPDGSGKTTLAKEMDKRLSPLFSSSEYYHGRFHLFPQLGGIKRLLVPSSKKKIQKELVQSSETDMIQRETLSVTRACINIIYYGTEYMVSRIPVWFKLRKNKLIVCDRYFYDYLLHPEYIQAPKWLIMLFTKLVPQPDLVLLIKCDAEVIFTRKKELPLEEIERQQQLLDTFKNVIDNTTTIDTNKPLVESVDDAVVAALNSLNSTNALSLKFNS